MAVGSASVVVVQVVVQVGLVPGPKAKVEGILGHLVLLVLLVLRAAVGHLGAHADRGLILAGHRTGALVADLRSGVPGKADLQAGVLGKADLQAVVCHLGAPILLRSENLHLQIVRRLARG